MRLRTVSAKLISGWPGDRGQPGPAGGHRESGEQQPLGLLADAAPAARSADRESRRRERVAPEGDQACTTPTVKSADMAGVSLNLQISGERFRAKMRMAMEQRWKSARSATADSRSRRWRLAATCSAGPRTRRRALPILDAFVDAGGTMIDTADVYSAWVPGHQGRRERGGDRPLAEARSGQARQGRHRDQGRLHGRPGARDDRAGLRCLAAAARDRHDRSLLPAQGRRERAAGRQPWRVRRAGARPARSARSACRNFTRRAARRGDGALPTRTASTRPCALQTWYNMRRARRSSRARCAMPRSTTAWRCSPSTASPTAS